MRARHLSPSEATTSAPTEETPDLGDGERSSEESTAPADSESDSVETQELSSGEEEASSGEDEVSDEPKEEAPKIPTLTPIIQALRAELASKDEQLKSYITAYKEATADMARERSRLERDRERTAERDRMSMASSLLDVLDNFDRSLDSGQKGGSADDLLTGLQLVHKQFLGALTRMGVERMHALGATFDASAHEATGMIPASGEQTDQEVVFEERPGYTFKGQLLRPARVVVASRPD